MVKAQQTIASAKHGCHFINGHADAIEKGGGDIFNITVRRYACKGEDNISEASVVTIHAKRIVIATGAYGNVKPNIQVQPSGRILESICALFIYYFIIKKIKI